MRDFQSDGRIKVLHPKAVPIFTDFINECEDTFDITLKVIFGLRTFDEQAAIYAKGRTAPGPVVSNAKPGYSFHNYGLAIDIAELKDGKISWAVKYEQFKPISDKYKLKWGGTFKSLVDKPHYELSFGFTIRELFEKYNKKDFIPGTKYLNL